MGEGGGGSVRPKHLKKCMENIMTCVLPPRKRLELPEELGGGGSVRPKYLKKCIKLNLNFQRGGGGGVLAKILSVGGVWVFSGITQ